MRRTSTGLIGFYERLLDRLRFRQPYQPPEPLRTIDLVGLDSSVNPEEPQVFSQAPTPPLASPIFVPARLPICRELPGDCWNVALVRCRSAAVAAAAGTGSFISTKRKSRCIETGSWDPEGAG